MPVAATWRERDAIARNPVRVTLGAIVALAVGLGIGRFAYTPIVPAMIDALGLNASAAGAIASANFLGYLAGAVAAASPRMRGSRRAWLLAALVVNGAAMVLMGATASLVPQLALRFANGAASAGILVFASSLVFELPVVGAKRNFTSWYFTGVGFGIIVSAASVALLLRAGAGWELLWLTNGAICVAGLLAVAILIPAVRRPPAAPALKLVSSAAARPRAHIVVAYGLFGFGYVITATFLVEIVRRSPDIAALEPWIWIVFGVCALPSIVVWNALGARIGVRGAYAVACIVEAIGVAASVLWSSIAGVLLAAIFLGGTFMGITALGLAAARDQTHGDPRRGIALMTAAFGLGQIIGPALAGILADLSGSFTAPTLAAAAALVLAASLATRAQR
ncbi:MAG: YbfB/YjiJ family MFS transporter [Proteobacteria bacterium]|nr:YbfB/YjiJ family MFS transporter [Pseudomonadota bacterium]